MSRICPDTLDVKQENYELGQYWQKNIIAGNQLIISVAQFRVELIAHRAGC